MILIQCAQGSAEWHAARAGVITASMFKVTRERVGGLTAQQALYVAAIREGKSAQEAAATADYKTKPRVTETVQRAIQGLPIGDFSDAAKKYAFTLAIERISGKPLNEGFETWQMKRGHELEPMARARHEEEAGVIVETAGFVTTDDSCFGASADGLIASDGGSEYKCLVSPDSLMPVLLDDDIAEYMDQIQGCMWITGRKWWHFGLYCPALEPAKLDLYWKHIDRNDDYIEAMERDLIAFRALVLQYESTLRLKAEAAQTQPAPAMIEAETETEAKPSETLAVDPRDALAKVMGGVTPGLATTSSHEVTGELIKLGEICARIAPLSITADGLAQLGFPPAKNEKAAKLYLKSQLPKICDALITLIGHAKYDQVATA